MTNRYVAYVRVSTARQGRSGLGLAGQRQQIKEFVGNSGKIVDWHEEHESGAMPHCTKYSDRKRSGPRIGCNAAWPGRGSSSHNLFPSILES